MDKRFKRSELLVVLLCTAILSSCSNVALKTDTSPRTLVSAETTVNKNAITVTSDMIKVDSDDYYSDWKTQNPSYIELSGVKASVNGQGAAVSGSKITITSAGVYAFSGKLDNGQIIVDVKEKGTVRLVLNGAEIKSVDNAPIYVKNAEKTVITLQEGTQNSMTDGGKYVFSDSATDEPDAAVFSKSNLTINGMGTLSIRANYKDAIASKDDLKITGGNINIYSADDGLVGKDLVLVKEGSITMETVGDGIKATNDTDTLKGFIAIEGGTFDIKSGTDAIQAETSVLVTAGKFNISTGGGSANASVKAKDERSNPMGQQGNTANTKTDETELKSAKAIKASSDITIKGGTFIIDSSDDALHSNNSVNIEGGDITITSGDDGIHADSSIIIKDGKVDVKKSYEGIESANITVSGGEVHVVSGDDGINVAGGNDGSAVNGRPGQNNFSSSGNNKLDIRGGYITVDSSGDGLDSNGAIYMTGGTVVVNGPTANNNGPLDYDGGFEMTGGFLIAAGSAGMAQAPSEQSKQYSLGMYYPNTQQAGALVNLKDSKGNTVVTFAPKKQYQSVVISSPELKKDAEYTLYSGGTSIGNSTDGLYKDGVYQGGAKVVSFTISNPVTWLNETGVTTGRSSNPGGPKGQRPGGSQGGPGKARP